MGKSLSQRGYVSKIIGHDWSLKSMAIDFLIWKELHGPEWLRVAELKNYSTEKSMSPKQKIEYLEYKFFESLAHGVNDALYEQYLTHYKFSQRRKTHTSRTLPCSFLQGQG